MVVLLVGLEVLGEVGDALAEEGDLHLGRAGVALVGGELADDRGLGRGVKHGALSGPAGAALPSGGLAGLTPGARAGARSGPPPGWPGQPWGRGVYAGRSSGQRLPGLPRPRLGDAPRKGVAGAWERSTDVHPRLSRGAIVTMGPGPRLPDARRVSSSSLRAHEPSPGWCAGTEEEAPFRVRRRRPHAAVPRVPAGRGEQQIHVRT